MEPSLAADHPLLQQVDDLLRKATDREGALTAVVQAVHESSASYDWTGIYLVEGDELVLHNFIGAPSPHSRIRIGEGICGAAAQEMRCPRPRPAASRRRSTR